MNYEHKYKEALGWMQSIYDGLHGATKKDAEHYFPELKKSEDERNKKIKKEVIEMLHYYHSKSPCFIPPRFSLEETLAWLEKQGQPCKSITWHDISEEPNEGEEILCEWKSKDAKLHDIAFYRPYSKTFWDGGKQIRNVTRWCYINDLIEKVGEHLEEGRNWIKINDCTGIEFILPDGIWAEQLIKVYDYLNSIHIDYRVPAWSLSALLEIWGSVDIRTILYKSATNNMWHGKSQWFSNPIDAAFDIVCNLLVDGRL